MDIGVAAGANGRWRQAGVLSLAIAALTLVGCGAPGTDSMHPNYDMTQQSQSGSSPGGGGGSSPSPSPSPPPTPAPVIPTTSLTVSWAPNSDLGVAGYLVHVGTSPDLLTTYAVGGVSSQPSVTMQVPQGATYYVSVQAYNTSGQFSVLSDSVSVVVN